MSLVSCARNPITCEWERSSSSDGDSAVIAYDLWFVNGDPSRRHLTPFFKYQYSYELQGLYALHLFLLAYYCVLCSALAWTVLRRLRRSRPYPPTLLLWALLSRALSLAALCSDHAAFVGHGQGRQEMARLGNGLMIFSEVGDSLEYLYLFWSCQRRMWMLGHQ